MDVYILIILVLGILLLTVTLASGWIVRLPLSYGLIYLLVGILVGPYGFDIIQVRPQAQFLERLTEFVVIVSLFSCGLKMNRPLTLFAWRSTARLIGFLMPISIFAVAGVGHWLLGFDWGAAILLGAILSPTDPVLASEVQISDIEDRDEVRFGLTSEGGLNDALGFPFVYFGLYLMENNQWSDWFRQWVAVDLIWALAAGIMMGVIVAKAIIWCEAKLLQFRPADSVMEDFTALSIILLTYSLTEIVNGYGFIAVFVAGIVVRRSNISLDRHLTQLEFIEKIEKFMEIVTVLLLGSLLRIEPIRAYASDALLLSGLLFFLIRPLGALLSTIGESFYMLKRLLYGWFGIRGIGSLYYLSYAFGKGLQGVTGEKIGWLVYLTVAFSVMLHGVTATPLMKFYEGWLENKRKLILR